MSCRHAGIRSWQHSCTLVAFDVVNFSVSSGKTSTACRYMSLEQLNRFQSEAVPKTKCSVAAIPLPPDLCGELVWWKSRCTHSTPDAFIFGSSREPQFITR